MPSTLRRINNPTDFESFAVQILSRNTEYLSILLDKKRSPLQQPSAQSFNFALFEFPNEHAPSECCKFHRQEQRHVERNRPVTKISNVHDRRRSPAPFLYFVSVASNQTSFRSVPFTGAYFVPLTSTARSLSRCNEVETKRCPRRDASRNFTRVGSLYFVSMRQTSARKSRRE